MRGRKPKPTPLKVLEGTRSDRVNAAAPAPPKARPECPAHLDQVATVEWDRMAALLDSMGVLAGVDGAALALYCDAHSRLIAANEAIELYGLLIDTEMGGLKANPAVAIAAEARSQMLRLLTEFGATPSSRSRLKTGADEVKRDKLGEFLNRRKAT